MMIKLAAIFVITASTANAGWLDSALTSDWPTVKSEAFKVEAYGFDFRVYEWQSKTDPDTVCTIAIGNNKNSPYMGMQCFKKEKITK